jgi:hypothetical protein
MSERGMKKWAPFSALPEQNAFIKRAKELHQQEIEPTLSEDQIAEIEFILNNYENECVEITYFNKKTLHIYGYITKIDPINGVIKINNTSIKIAAIKSIEIKNSYDY